MSVAQESPATNLEQRVPDGRNARAGAGAPGNPYARRVAELRWALVEGVTPDDMRDIAVAMTLRAQGGNVQAAKLLLQYTLGKPVEQPHPDRIDRDEIEAFRANAIREGDQPVAASTPLSAALIVARELVPAKGKAFTDGLVSGLKAQREQEQAAVSKREKRAKPTPVSAAEGQADAQPGAPRPVSPPDRRAANDRRS
jgi:hypothetical protein